jgi:ribosomal-protein-alanine N-acetyltransferase
MAVGDGLSPHAARKRELRDVRAAAHQAEHGSCQVVLRPLEPSEAADLLALRRRNRRYFAGSEPRRDGDWLTLQRQGGELAAEAAARAAGRSLTFGVFVEDVLVGRVALTAIVRGAFLNAYLAYAIDEDHAGRGIATAAVSQAISSAWDHGLHRVQAAVSPQNTASKRVLEKVGFRREGLALRYLRLAGRWADQELWAITTEDTLDVVAGIARPTRR